MNESAVYVSPSTARSLWQEYRIYERHVEFDTHIGTVTIPFDNIESVEVQGSDVKALLRGDLRLKSSSTGRISPNTWSSTRRPARASASSSPRRTRTNSRPCSTA